MTPTPSPSPHMSDESNRRQAKQISNKKNTISSVCATTKDYNKGAWTADENKKLAEVIAVHGPKRWKTIATKAGLNRCGKSCRLRWMNYLRPNIKRGNITDQEEDLILRLHKLLGNRWSLIAGRLPGRTDNEIKNYWNSHLSKKINTKAKQSGAPQKDLSCKAQIRESNFEQVNGENKKEGTSNGGEDTNADPFDIDEFFDFSSENPMNLEWVSRFLEMDDNKSHPMNNNL